MIRCVAFVVVGILLIGCRAPQSREASTAERGVLFERAFVTREHVTEAMEFEAKLAKRYHQPAPAGQPWFEILPGDAKVLIVAGHATPHMREGAFKSQDGGTGGWRSCSIVW